MLTHRTNLGPSMTERPPVTNFCAACGCRHSHRRWYGTGNWKYCGIVYGRLLRRGARVCHPSWPEYEDNVETIDETGARISAAKYRVDVGAIQNIWALCSMYPGWESPTDILLLGILAGQYYFSWPMHAFVHEVCSHSPARLGSRVSCIGEKIFARFQCSRFWRNGLVTGTSKGIGVTKNPTERRNGIVRFRQILDDFTNSRSMCAAMAAYLQKPGKVSIVVMLKILGESASSVFSGKTTYKNVRICRIMAVTAQKEFQNSPQDWNVFSRMSPHLRSALKRRGITTYELAIQFAEAISNVIGMPSYTLNDFSIYTCLLDR
jgi:hypothetical protein